MRAIVAKTSEESASYKNIVLAASVLLIAGFLFLLEGIISLIIHW